MHYLPYKRTNYVMISLLGHSDQSGNATLVRWSHMLLCYCLDKVPPINRTLVYIIRHSDLSLCYNENRSTAWVCVRLKVFTYGFCNDIHFTEYQWLCPAYTNNSNKLPFDRVFTDHHQSVIIWGRTFHHTAQFS